MNGLIAFFDILGYQSFLQNNSATKTAEKVLDLINEIPHRAKEDASCAWLDNAKATPDDYANEIHKSFSHVIFSDTIMFSIVYPKGANEDWKRDAIFYMWFCSMLLSREMFIEGLPLRGAVTEGSFIIKNLCFAGDAIIRAYKLCQSLNLSTVVFDESLNDRLPKCFNAGYKKILIEYLTPLKNSEEKKFIHINWLDFCAPKETKNITIDVEKFVLRSFWSHNKDCPKVVDEKISNTTKLFRRFLLAIENK